MPTGGGKSLCYRPPAHDEGGDHRRRVAAHLADEGPGRSRADVRRAAVLEQPRSRRGAARQVTGGGTKGRCDLLFISPERSRPARVLAIFSNGSILALSPSTRPIASATGAMTFARNIGKSASSRTCSPRLSLHGYTATATKRSATTSALQPPPPPNPSVLVGNFDRPNLSLPHLAAAGTSSGQVQGRLAAAPERSRHHLLPAPQGPWMKSTPTCKRKGVKCLPYHAGLTPEERRSSQDAFAQEKCDLIVATVAFGMGIDKSDVRFVVHYDLPKTVESYQETGRSGRDGLPARPCCSSASGRRRRAQPIEGGGRGGGGERRRRVRARPGAGAHRAAQARLHGRLRHGLAPARGAARVLRQPRGAVRQLRHLLDPPETFDATEQARMALSCVYRPVSGSASPTSSTCCAAERGEVWRSRRAQHLGIGAELSRDHWQELIRQLIHRGYLVQDIARYSALRLTEASRPLLRGEETLIMARPR